MKYVCLFAAAIAMIAGARLVAFPEGAPWGAADPTVQDHCASCHWERPAKMQSSQISLTGFPQRFVPGETYELVLTLTDDQMKTSGFQLLAEAEDQPAGVFKTSDDDLEIALTGTAIRSITPKVAIGHRVRWKVRWQTPTRMEAPIRFVMAASAANDDGSPFGDVIHYQTVRVE
ncbi:MAG: choice-of-anchor V domain-containing protein [Woeseiaceae bacterium]